MTTLLQSRKVLVEDGSTVLRIQSTVTDKGALPDNAAFLITIGDPSDPKSDAFSRVIDASMFLTTSTDRPTAIARGDVYFRTSTVKLDYTSVSDANNAAGYVRERVNALTKDWNTLNDEYLSDGSEYQYPTEDEGVLAPLINVYTSLVAQSEDLSAQYTAQAATCAALSTTIATATASRDAAAAAVSSIQSALFAAQAVRTNSAVAAAASAGDKSALDANISSLNAAYQDQLLLLQDSEASLSTASAEQEACARDLAAINAVLIDTEARASMTLAEIVALCPSYTG